MVIDTAWECQSYFTLYSDQNMVEKGITCSLEGILSTPSNGGIVSKLVHWFKYYGFIKLLVEVLPHIYLDFSLKMAWVQAS